MTTSLLEKQLMKINYQNPDLVLSQGQVAAGKIAWRSPSNIAIIKYWGKYGRQLPQNASISFTLTNAHTNTWMSYEAQTKTQKTELEFFFEGKANPAFQVKIEKFLASIDAIFPFLKQMKLSISSENSFPHSAGIASSASAMSALALCLCSMERDLFGTLAEEAEFLKKVSFVARLGSGSASRSVYPVMAAWGESPDIPEASNLFAVPCADKVHEVFHTFHDDVLFISSQEKSVSSRAGHALMEGNVYASARYAQARSRMTDLIEALKTGDLTRFGEITENEALSLHALMMTSNPSYILMTPNSLAAINEVRAFRAETRLPLYFSLDAGPNLHLLYPHSIKEKVHAFIKERLTVFCEGGKWLADVAGQGAFLIDN